MIPWKNYWMLLKIVLESDIVKLKQRECLVQGTPISQGIAIGNLRFFTHDSAEIPELKVSLSEVPKEIERYNQALNETKNDLQHLKKQLENEHSHEAAAILETHLQLLEDPILVTEIKDNIAKTKKNADFVFHCFLMQYQKKFNKIQDLFFRERGCDLLDISRRVLGHLRGTERSSLLLMPPGSIVFSHEIAASDVAEADLHNICAIITDTGGNTSHAAIVAKAKGIPYIANVSFELLEEAEGTEVIVDARSGEIILFPSKKTLTKYRKAQEQIDATFQELEKICSLKAETYDGYQVGLVANIEMVNEIGRLHQYGGAGVGLFRSEYIFLSQQRFPSEDEQYAIYSRIVKEMKGLPIVIRTFDVGGDKLTVEQQASLKGNPYLGCRAIRFLLREPEIFRVQIRAILRASEGGNVSIMFPMISDLSELIEAKELIAEVQNELSHSGKVIEKKVRIGCMIEVPSAAIISDLIAKECDFIAIGTNDLVQYLLAVDRSNQAVNQLYTPMHPALIRIIKLIVGQASRFGVPVSVCGEIAGDPRFTPLLLGLGVNELSVSLRSLPLIKTVIRNTSIVRCHELVEEVQALATPSDIQELLNREFQSIFPDSSFGYICNSLGGA